MEENKKINVVDENGISHEAEILTILRLEETKREYAVYSIAKPDSSDVIICSSILTKDENGNDKLIEIQNANEKNMVVNVVKNMIVEGEKNGQ